MISSVTPNVLRPAPWWLFVLLLVATVLMTVLGNYWYLPSGVWKPLYEHTHGLVNPTLIWGLAFFIIVIRGILLGAGRRMPAEVGIERPKIITAGIYACVLWILVQFVLGVSYVGFGKSLAIANGWDGVDVLEKMGGLLGQLLGNALCEEILFRGFLLMQCLLFFRTLWPHRPRTAFVAALWLATAIFTLLHLPYQLSQGNDTPLSNLALLQFRVFFAGCVFGWIYWQTRNLFFVVVVHAIQNEPTTLFAWHDLGPMTTTTPVVLLISVGIAAAWHRLPATDRRPAS